MTVKFSVDGNDEGLLSAGAAGRWIINVGSIFEQIHIQVSSGNYSCLAIV